MVKTTGIEILQRLRPCKIRQAHNILMLALLEKNLGLTYASKYPSYCIKNENMTIRIWNKYVFGRFSEKAVRCESNCVFQNLNIRQRQIIDKLPTNNSIKSIFKCLFLCNRIATVLVLLKSLN